MGVIVDQDVRRPEPLFAGVEESGDSGRLGEVRLERRGPAAAFGDIGDDELGACCCRAS
jgi:hypothetical protein